MKTSSIKKLNELPEEFLISFLDFLEDEENFRFISNQIGNTGVIVEAGGYQLSIQTKNELLLIKSELEAIDEREIA
ncbi:MAG: hypothetical protein ACOC2U_05075 [bacterium]